MLNIQNHKFRALEKQWPFCFWDPVAVVLTSVPVEHWLQQRGAHEAHPGVLQAEVPPSHAGPLKPPCEHQPWNAILTPKVWPGWAVWESTLHVLRYNELTNRCST